jgi:hypothetical protein
VREVDETSDLVANLLSLARQEVSHERISADGCASDNQAVTGMEDAKFGRCRGRHVLVRTVSRAFGGDGGEAGCTYLYGEGFKRVGSVRCRADNVNVVEVSDNLSPRMCCGRALKGSLERESEQEGAERVPLLHAAGGEDRGGVVWRPSQENPRRAAVCPGEKRKECGSLCLSCVKDCLARDTVEGILAVQGQV